MNEGHRVMTAIVIGIVVVSGMAIFGLGGEKDDTTPVYSLGCIPEKIMDSGDYSANVIAPSTWDWRNQGIMTSVKNQGRCGSCVAFASNGAFEAIIKWKTGQSVDLSEAQVFFCTGSECDNGMYVSTALNYMETNGVADEDCFPYDGASSGTNLACEPCDDWQQRAYKLKDWGTVSGATNIKNYLVNYGPLVVTYAVYEDFDDYWWNPSAWDNQVYTHSYGALRGYHAVVLVGYNDYDGYWICKNSWGTSGGINGYFKIGYGEPSGSDDPIDDGAYYLIYEPVFKANAGGPYSGKPGENIYFHGSAYGGTEPYTWHWDFGDGATSNEQNPTHAYSKAGTYTVTLTVTDSNGKQASDTAKVTVNTPPTSPSVSGPTSGKISTTLLFTFKSTDADGDKIKYVVDWGDGKHTTTDFYDPGKEVMLDHRWYHTGEYVIRVRAEDERGGESKITYHNIRIGASNPPYTPSPVYPPDNSTGIELNPTLLWNGGDPDGETVYYTVYIGTNESSMEMVAENITSTSYYISSLQPFTRYYWKIMAYDESGMYSLGGPWTFLTRDMVSPDVKIISPIENALYIHNFTIPFIKTFVIGKVMVEVNATDTQSGVERVEFYVDDVLMANVSSPPYQWFWNEDTLYDTHVLKVIAYDRDGNKAEDSMEVTVLNIFS